MRCAVAYWLSSLTLRQALLLGADTAQTAAFLVLLRAKGETAAEVAGLARAMRKSCLPVDAGPGVLDIVGTGGDRRASRSAAARRADSGSVPAPLTSPLVPALSRQPRELGWPSTATGPSPACAAAVTWWRS